jgi:alginate O-acetyltransferase complex protein AlgI
MTKPARPSDGRFLVVWAILLGGLVAGWALAGVLTRGEWLGAMMAVYFGPFKVATLIALTRAERREWTWPRLLAYFLWLGMQPRQFLPSYSPPRSPPPTWRGCLLNAFAGAVLLWGVPLLFPAGTPLLVRAWTGLVGMALLRLFGVLDVVALIFRALGFPVEKAWVNPLAATSLRDFWGRRWNRIMSGLLRDLLFVPLARRVGVLGASAIAFAYSGVLHEFVSVLARSGYGGPTLYFLIQGVAFAAEGTRIGRNLLARSPLVGWCWTALVVVAPVGLVLSPAFMAEVIVPALREMWVPGLPPDDAPMDAEALSGFGPGEP